MQSHSVVRRIAEVLVRAEITFCCLHRRVTEKKLKLLEVPTGSTTELRTRAPKIVWPDVECEGTGVLRYDIHDGLSRER
jgi:hypothetical protein